VAASLKRAGEMVRQRPEPLVWSALEYAAHLADALRWYAERLERIRAEHRPQFSIFDWDAACEERRYNERDVDDVLTMLATSAACCVDEIQSLNSARWIGEGIGSDGTPRSPASQASRAGHEVLHHLYDMAAGLRALGVAG
jgi:hypothetical protein